MLGLRRSSSHPATDKGVKHFAESGENGLEVSPEVPFLMGGIESDRGHGDLLANLRS